MSNLLHLTSNFATRLREARLASGLPQAAAAKRLKVSLRTYQAWEAGAAFPQLRHRKRLSDFIEKHEEAA